jgi:alpha-mannosidase
MPPEEGSRFSGLDAANLPSVSVIEDGAVRTVVEALFSWGDSFICQQYKLPKQGSEIEISLRVWWNEKDRMLKLLVPTTINSGKYLGQTAYGFEELKSNGEEVVSQKWSAVVSEADNKAFNCINDCIYGSSCKEGEIGLSLLRSAAYSTTDFLGRKAVPQDRLTPRMDQGDRCYSFWINGGEAGELLNSIDRVALIHNEKPYALSYCPSGEGNLLEPLVILSDESILLSTFKKAEKSEDYIIRLFEPTGQSRETSIKIPLFHIEAKLTMDKFEIKTLRLNTELGTLEEMSLMEI